VTLSSSQYRFITGGVYKIDESSNVLGGLIDLDGSVLDRLVQWYVEEIFDEVTVSSAN